MNAAVELHPVVSGDRRLYDSHFSSGAPATVGELLDGMAGAVAEASGDGDPTAVAYFSNWHRDCVGTPDHDDVRLAVARAHGFADWEDATAAGDRQFDPSFEAAVDAVVNGDAASLTHLLAAHPDLIRERSPLGHAATLLHYVAANGVEFRRQACGPMAPAIADLLLSRGAEVDALANTYGGGTSQTTLVLLLTSGHPAQAGVTNAVVDLLLRHGANPNGVNGDGAPVRAARSVGNDGAVTRLRAAGASG
jgi:hypothetical protein